MKRSAGIFLQASDEANVKKPLVTQELLADYRELKQMELRRKELRLKIISLLENGASIEPGKFTAWLDVALIRPLTLANLNLLLGEDEVLSLQQAVAPKRIVYLRMDGRRVISLSDLLASSRHEERKCPPRHP